MIVDEIKTKPPRVIIYQADGLGHNPMDKVPHYVRHYELSTYINQNYKPFIRLNNHTLFIRNDLQWKSPEKKGVKFKGTLTTSNLYSAPPGCNWGYAPHFIAYTEKLTKNPLKFVTIQKDDGTFLTEIDLKEEIDKSNKILQLSFLKLKTDTFFIHDKKNNLQSPTEQIKFKSITSKNKVYQIQLASCPQWQSFAGRKLYISHHEDHVIEYIHLE